MEKLDLSCNKISDINVLEKVNFKQLKELNLFDNGPGLKEISVLEKVQFENLEKLNLCWNPITNIKILEKTNFYKLKDLSFEQPENKKDKISLWNYLKLKFKDLEIPDLEDEEDENNDC